MTTFPHRSRWLPTLGLVLLVGVPAANHAADTDPRARQIEEMRAAARYAEARDAATAMLGELREDPTTSTWRLREAEILIATLERAAALPTEAQSELAAADRLSTSIEAHMEGGRFEKAWSESSEQVAVRRRYLGNTCVDIVPSLVDLAAAEWKLGRHARGVSAAREGFAIAEGAFDGKHPLVAECSSMLGLVLMAQGHYDEAEASFKRALEMFRELIGEENEEVSMCLNNLGALYGETEDAVLSERYYRDALAMNQRLLGNDNLRVARSMHNLGFHLNGMGDYLGAEKLLRDALDIRRRLLGPDHPDVALTAHILGQVHRARHEYDVAEALFREALAIRRARLGPSHSLVAWNLYDLAGLKMVSEEYAAAEVLAREALDIWSETDEVANVVRGTLWVASVCFAQGRTEEAAALYQEVARLQRTHFGKADFRALTAMGRCASLLGEHTRAESLLTAAATGFEAWRLRSSTLRTRIRAQRGSPYRLLAVEHMLGDRTDQAWAAVERSHGRGLTDVLVATDGDASSPEARGGHVVSLAEVQRTLSPEVALIGWLEPPPDAGGPVAWMYILRHEGPVLWVEAQEAVRSRGKPDMLSPGEDFKEQLHFDAAWPVRVTDVERIRVASHRVWSERFAPGLPHLIDVDHLVIVPSRGMLGIPVEALVDTEGRYVGERFGVTYVSSATAYAWLRDRRDRRDPSVTRRALLVGDPPITEKHLSEMTKDDDTTLLMEVSVVGARSFSDATMLRSALAGNRDAVASLPRLSGSRGEVARIASLIPGAKVLLGPDASEERIAELSESGALTRFDAIHFATHALIDDWHPDRSALVLSQTDLPDPRVAPSSDHHSGDGLLSATEIAQQWRLNADLVTLSGCKTALGRTVPGGGYIGFAYALYEAGAQSVMVSLWDVDDTATYLLMTRFYENLTGRFDDVRDGMQATPMPKSRALREAKRWLMYYADKDGAHPFAHPSYWSAFILMGDPS